MTSVFGRYGKAIGSAATAFITSIVTALVAKPGTPDFGDLNTVDWLTAAAFTLAALGFTAVIPKGDEVLRVDSQGELRAGPASRFTTGNVVNENVPMDQLLPKGET